MGFGSELKNILQKRGMKVTHLSKETGIPVNTLYAIISRDSNNISTSTSYKICNALDLDPDEQAILDMCLYPDKWGIHSVNEHAPEVAPQKSNTANQRYEEKFKDNDFLQEMAEKAQKLNDEHDRELIITMLNAMLDKHKKE